jgi:hypothetical protein
MGSAQTGVSEVPLGQKMRDALWRRPMSQSLDVMSDALVVLGHCFWQAGVGSRASELPSILSRFHGSHRSNHLDRLAIGAGLITTNPALKMVLLVGVDMIHRLTDPERSRLLHLERRRRRRRPRRRQRGGLYRRRFCDGATAAKMGDKCTLQLHLQLLD